MISKPCSGISSLGRSLWVALPGSLALMLSMPLPLPQSVAASPTWMLSSSSPGYVATVASVSPNLSDHSGFSCPILAGMVFVALPPTSTCRPRSSTLSFRVPTVVEPTALLFLAPTRRRVQLSLPTVRLHGQVRKRLVLIQPGPSFPWMPSPPSLSSMT